MHAEDDTLGFRNTEGLIQGVDGYAAWRRGEREKAWTLLRVAQREATASGPAAYILRYWLGTLALEVGRPADAQRYFASNFWEERSLVADGLGQAYEAGGDREK